MRLLRFTRNDGIYLFITCFLLLTAFLGCALLKNKTIFNTGMVYPTGSPYETAALRLVEKARVLIENGDYLEAQRFLEKALIIDPKNPYSYFFLGVLMQKKENYETSLGYFEKGLSLLPHHSFWLAQTHKHLGLGFYKLGNRKKAFSHFEKSLEYDPRLTESQNYVDKLTLDDEVSLIRVIKWEASCALN